MEYKADSRAVVLRLDKGEELLACLKKVCEDEGILLGVIQGLGAVSKVTIGLFDTQEKKYYSNTLEGDFEIVSLTGNISTMKEECYLHCHAAVAGKDGKTYGGHLNEAWVSATAEIVIQRLAGQVDRVYSEEIGLNLIQFE